MAVLMMVLTVGPNAVRRAKKTGYSMAFIDSIAMHMREAGLWNNNVVDDREWWDQQGELVGERLFARALVGLGLVERHKTFEGYVYVDTSSDR